MRLGRLIAATGFLCLLGGTVLAVEGLNDHGQPAPTPAGSREILYFRNPMNPSSTSPTPMKDEMGMAYIPVYASDSPSPPGAAGGRVVDVAISPTVVDNLGVRIATAQNRVLERRIVGNGIVQFNEDATSRIHLAAGGWVQRLYVRSEGMRVKQGDPLLEIVSPALMTAQETYLDALRLDQAKETQQALDRLAGLGFPDALVARIRESRVPERSVLLTAPQPGVVAKVGAAEGVNVAPYSESMIVTDNSSVWVLANVLDRYAPWLAEGQKATVSLVQGRADGATGRVAHIFPGLDPATRTLKLRLLVSNADGMLRFDAPVRVEIDAGESAPVLAVQRSALIQTPDGERVILALGDGRFRPQPVTAGAESGDWVQIRAGLTEGDAVVMQGEFLIDSESSVRTALAAYAADGEAANVSRADPIQVATATVETVTATGTVVKVGPDKLTLAHDPIPALQWPAMTMDFAVAQPALLKRVPVGSRVRFTFLRQGMNLTVTGIEPMTSPTATPTPPAPTPSGHHHNM